MVSFTLFKVQKSISILFHLKNSFTFAPYLYDEKVLVSKVECKIVCMCPTMIQSYLSAKRILNVPPSF